MPAPPPMQFAQMPGLMQGSTPTPGDQMKTLAKNIGSATKSMFPNLANMQPVAPGAPVPGAAGPTAAGGPMGPAPLPGQQALPGSPYSPQAGPPAPPPGPPLVTNQPAGGATAAPPMPPGGIPMPQARPPGAPGPVPGAPGASPVAAMLQSMNPMQRQAVLQAISQGGMGGPAGVMPGGVPGSNALGGAGMIPGGMGGVGGSGL